MLSVLAHLQAGHEHAARVGRLAREERDAVVLEVLGRLDRGRHVGAFADCLAAVRDEGLRVLDAKGVLTGAGERDVAGELPHAAAVLRVPRRVRTLFDVHRERDALVVAGALLVVDVLKHLVVDAFLVLDPAVGVGAGDHLAAELRDLLDRVDGHVARAVYDDLLTLEGVALALEVLVDEVDKAVAGCLGAGERAAEGEALAGEHAGPFVADALVLAEHVSDFAAADTQVTCGNVGVRANVAVELGHERLAEAHDLVVGLALRVEVGAALAAAHRQRGQRVLEDLLEAQELQHAQINRGVEAQAALVGADCGVVLDAEAAVDLDFALVINPRNAELDDALGLDDALEDLCFLVFRMRLDDRLEGVHDLGDGLDELGLIGVLRLNLVDDSLDVTHVTSSGFTCSQPRPL